MSIKTKLLIFALSISLIPISIITTVNYLNARSALKHHVMNEMTAIAESKKLHLLSYIDEKKGRAIDFSSDGFMRNSLETITSSGIQSHAVSRLNEHLKMNKMPLDPHLLAIDIVDIDGRVVSSTMEASYGRKVSDYEIFQQLINGVYGSTYIKEPHYSQTLNRLDIDIYAPLFPQRGGDAIGAIILHYNPSAFNLITSDRTGMGETGEVYVVNREKKMITESRFINDIILRQTVDTEPVRRIIEDGNGGMTGIYPDYRGVPIVGASVDIPKYGWVLLAEMDISEAFASISRLRIFTISMGGVSAVVIIVLVIILSRRITNPIQKLVEGTRKIASGDLGFKISTKSKDEIGFLANSFNNMTTQLEESQRQLQDYALNLEHKVKGKTQEINDMLDELKYKNEEMEQLIYVTSHDLRSPLLNIQGFSKELKKDIEAINQTLNEDISSSEIKTKLSDTLGVDIPEALRFILASSSKMDVLLSGLLRLSRMGRITYSIKLLDMNNLISNILETHEYKIMEKKVTFNVEELPQCRGDSDQINQVFSNLLDNALKYLDSNREGIIRISGKKEDEHIVYCLEDNGIGIAERHQDKVFEIFHRLDPGDSVVGEGLGLAIVRKILDRHDGKIWVESESGEGSKFFVSLPE
jgi:signal transduction histidine kinase